MKPQRLFPPHIRRFDAAVTFVVDWAEMMGGDITADVVVVEHDRMLDVGRTRVAFVATETVLTFSFTVDAGLVASRYQFDLRRSNGVLLWRHDCHPGHEASLGGRHHLHIGPEEEHRIPAEPVTLEHVATKVVATHINLTS